MRLRPVMVSVVLATCFAVAESPQAPGETLAREANAYLAAAIKANRIPALSAGIAIDGRIVWTGAVGLADIENGTPATPETPFRIASISKVLTAAAILQMAESGTIDLDASVQTYLPNYPPPARGTMTVRTLLAHTSGIRHSKGDESRQSLVRYDSLADATTFFRDRKLAAAPGKRYRYSSYGFTVLGAILEAATGQPFESYMREHVWGPAKMGRTGLDKRPVERGSAASLYRLERGRPVPDTRNDLSLIYPGGGMVSTPKDLLQLVAALEDGTLLSAESVARMLGESDDGATKTGGPAGLGWNVWSHEAHGLIVSRVGGQSGASALLVSYVDRGVTVALLTNLARLDPIWELTNDLIGIGIRAKAASP